MNETLFLLISALVLTAFLIWGFKQLPKERWQMLAVIPKYKNGEHGWCGVNITYYGFFIATGQMLALGLLVILLAAAAIPLTAGLTAVCILLTVCLPAARLVAVAVEGKYHTFTIGGASFVGIVLAPAAIHLANDLWATKLHTALPAIPVLAAMAIAYTLGEGLGRLACISYGCCYGKPLNQCGRVARTLFAPFAVVFTGNTRKAVYESRLDGEPLLPVQAITAVIYTGAALTASSLFLTGNATAALLLAIGVSQLWRFFSETLRADFRGFGRISAYQKMGLVAVLYVVLYTWLTEQVPLPARPDILKGLATLWQPGIILALQGLWLVFFLYFGRSTVTSATVTFQLAQERI